MKWLWSLIVVCALFWPTSAITAEITFSWTQTPEVVDGYYLYVADSSLVSPLERITVAGHTNTTYTYDDTGLGQDWLFFRMTAYIGEEESDNTYEIIRKYCEGVSCKGVFTATGGANIIQLTWENIPSIGSYLIKLVNNADDSSVLLDDIVGSPYQINAVAGGSYTVSVFPKNADGNTIEGTLAETSGNNVFDPQVVTVTNQDPPTTPSFWIESFGNGGIAGYQQKIIVAFDESSLDPEISSYKVGVYSTKLLAEFGAGGDVISDTVVSVGSNYCRVANTTNHPIVYISVSARNASGSSGEPVIGYKLIGNIAGTYNDGISSEAAGFDSGDLNAFRFNIRRSTGEDISTYCTMENLYDHLSNTYSSDPWKRADYDTDGSLGRPDLYFYKRVTE